MLDVENRRKAILVLKSRVQPVVQMFALAQDWFMVFPALVPLVIFTAEHVYSGNPGDRFSAQGVISHNKRVIYNWYKSVWVYMKHGVYSKQYSLTKRADKISYYLVFMTYVGCFSSKSMVSTIFCPPVCLSVCPFVCLSVCPSHLFDYVSIIIMKFSGVITTDQGNVHAKVKVRGQRWRSQRSTANLAVSGL